MIYDWEWVTAVSTIRTISSVNNNDGCTATYCEELHFRCFIWFVLIITRYFKWNHRLVYFHSLAGFFLSLWVSAFYRILSGHARLTCSRALPPLLSNNSPGIVPQPNCTTPDRRLTWIPDTVPTQTKPAVSCNPLQQAHQKLHTQGLCDDVTVPTQMRLLWERGNEESRFGRMCTVAFSLTF